MTFLVSDGVFPSNEERGYVLRRIVRRAIRHAYLLGVADVVLPAMVDRVVELMGPDYPEIENNHQFVREVIEREEQRFRQTLEVGSTILDTALSELSDGAALSGQVAFQLHDTYGFPLEVTEEVAAERGFSVDRDTFDAEMAGQRDRARAAQKNVGVAAGASDFAALVDEHGTTEFTGREENTSSATVLGVVDDSIVVDRTPFYAESGGQLGDHGIIETATGSARVIDTQYGAPGQHRARGGRRVGRDPTPGRPPH